jgi:hypothetical protein
MLATTTVPEATRWAGRSSPRRAEETGVRKRQESSLQSLTTFLARMVPSSTNDMVKSSCSKVNSSIATNLTPEDIAAMQMRRLAPSGKARLVQLLCSSQRQARIRAPSSRGPLWTGSEGAFVSIDEGAPFLESEWSRAGFAVMVGDVVEAAGAEVGSLPTGAIDGALVISFLRS